MIRKCSRVLCKDNWKDECKSQCVVEALKEVWRLREDLIAACKERDGLKMCGNCAFMGVDFDGTLGCERDMTEVKLTQGCREWEVRK